MDKEQEKRTLEEKLAKCRKLAAEFTDGVTAKNLRDLAEELEQRIRGLGQ